jgi:hypothetical protein
MATQTAKIIDVTRTFVPVDPNAFPENLSATNREDYPEQKKPVMCYAGHNFMPTPYGYKSFFGINSVFDADSLESRADELFIVQTNTFENILVALTEDGIWTKQGDSSGAWTQAIALEAPDEGSHLDWTYCLIGNTLFCYRATEPQYYSFSTLNTYFTPGVVPSAVTGLAVTENAGIGSLAAGNYYYRVAFFQADGQLSLATTAEVEVTNLNSQNVVTWNTLPAAVNGYRLYVTFGATTHYVDVPQDATPEFVHNDEADIPNLITLPDQSPIVQYEAYEFYAVTPTFLNMEGQQGIFKAGSRLGFWDTENSVSWSNIDDFADFTPSVKTLAGAAVFNEVIGRITMILSSADGFVIYATKSIVHIGRNLQTTFNWNPTVVAKGTGIAFKRQCCSSSPDTTQFAYTTTGLMQIEGNKGEYIVPEVTDYLKESSEPVFLKILEGRYLFLEILDGNYLNGLVEFEEVYVPGSEFDFAFEVINDYYNGEMPGQQDAIEQARIDLGLPERADGQEYQGRIQGTLLDQTEFTPLDVELPTFVPSVHEIDTSDFSKIGLKLSDAGGNLLSYTEGDFFPISLILGQDRAIGEGEEDIFANVAPPKIVTDSVKLAYDSPAVNNDELVRVNSVDEFFARQREIWERNGNNALQFVAYVANREDNAELTQRADEAAIGGWHEPGQVIFASGSGGEEGEIYTTAEDIYVGPRNLLAQYPSETIYYPQDFGVPVTEFQDVYYWNTAVGHTYGKLAQYITVQDAELGTVTTGYATPYVRFENGVFYIRRQATHVTTLYGHAELTPRRETYEEAVVGEALPPLGETYWNGTRYWERWFIDAVGTVYAGTGNIEDLNVYEETSVGLTGYDYIDINGDAQFIPIEAITFDIPEDIPEIESPPFPTIPSLVLPPTSFLLQTGSIGPIYPTIPGAYVFDMQLKKWGKMKQDYKLLMDFSPINNTSGSVVSNDNFGITGGMLKTDGKIALFDKFPDDSAIKYGKIGYYRQGFTSLQEVRMTFRDVSDGSIKVETSIDGVSIDSSLTQYSSFYGARHAEAYPNISGRWHTVTITGVWDLKHLEYRGYAAGNR